MLVVERQQGLIFSNLRWSGSSSWGAGAGARGTTLGGLSGSRRSASDGLSELGDVLLKTLLLLFANWRCVLWRAHFDDDNEPVI